MSKPQVTKETVPSDPGEIYQQYAPVVESWKDEGGHLGVVAESLEAVATRGERR